MGVTVDADGNGWTSAKGNLLTSATNAWKDNTDFDPVRVTGSQTGPYDVFIDGRQPICGNFASDDLAITCLSYQYHYYPQDPTVLEYQRITHASVYFNTGGWTYSFSSGGPPDGTVDFQGIATHEIGHWVLLIDLQDSESCVHNNQRDTMCGVFYGPVDTFYARTLTAEDITSANMVYP